MPITSPDSHSSAKEKASMSKKAVADKKPLAEGYNAFKEFEGRKYTGMKIGGHHTWYYDQGEWKETKVTPDEWQFTYEVNKHRKGRAPEGSGAPVGTEYHWYILADQTVKKLNANDYTTSMAGLKFKLAHKRAGSETWSASERAQARHLIRILGDKISQLHEAIKDEEGPEPEQERVAPIKQSPRSRGRRRTPENPLVMSG